MRVQRERAHIVGDGGGDIGDGKDGKSREKSNMGGLEDEDEVLEQVWDNS